MEAKLLERIKEQLIRHECLWLKPYRCTVVYQLWISSTKPILNSLEPWNLKLELENWNMEHGTICRPRLSRHSLLDSVNHFLIYP
ncbi:MAG: hypothetical protein PHI68_05780 [Candidatus Cloacimonetes bacterium]|nr:hypothetical protein [Candidatus Cloacimonadota bacterium]